MKTAKNAEEAKTFFIENHTDKLLCEKPSGEQREVESYAEAEEFFNDGAATSEAGEANADTTSTASPTSVRAKMNCHFIDTADSEKKVVHLSAVATGSAENEEFSKYTPAANLSISIAADKPAANFFEVGKDYYVDFTPAQ